MSHTPKKENPFVNLLLNIVIPTLILVKLSGPDHLGPRWGIVVALAFPIGYGIYDFFRVRKVNLFSALGVVSIFLTGGMSLLELDPKYIAIKEATIPGLFAIATLVSLKTRYPLVRTLLYNDKIMQTDRVHAALVANGNEQKFDGTLTTASYLIALSFCLSSVLNYGLAKYILVSKPGTEAFAEELGKMTALSMPVIFVPSMIVMMGTLYFLYVRITRLTGLSIDHILVDPEADKNNNDDSSQKQEI